MIGIILYSTILSLQAFAGQSNFSDAFQSYVEMKSLEQELAILPYSREHDLEKKENDRLKFYTALSEQSRKFRSLLQPQENDQLEQTLFKNLRSKKISHIPLPSKEAIDYLSAQFPPSKKLSAMEWQVIREWFGKSIQESFLRMHFNMAKIEIGETNTTKEWRRIYVVDPYERFRQKNPAAYKDPISQDENIEYLELSAFNKIEDQAEELYRILKDNYSEDPSVIITSGESSAIFYKTLDLHPDLRHAKFIKAWINADGRLYGLNPKPNKTNTGRALASVEKANPSRTLEEETIAELYRLHGETRMRATPIGKGFPIFNVLTFDEKYRATQNLGESVVQEGSSFYVEKGPASRVVESLLSQLHEASRGLRDSPNAGFSI